MSGVDTLRRHPVAVAAIVLIGLVLSPFVVARISNNIALARFAGQLDEAMPEGKKFEIWAEGSLIYPDLGSGPYCDFRATRVVYVFSSDEFLNNTYLPWLRSIKFKPAGHRVDSQPAKSEIWERAGVVTIVLDDGPADAGFDIRCW